jgi:hypothetical protein
MEKAKPWEKATNKRKSFQGPGTPTGEVKPWEKTLKRRKPQGAGQEAGQKLGVPAVPGTPMGEAKPWEKTPKKRKPKKPRKPKSNKAATK